MKYAQCFDICFVVVLSLFFVEIEMLQCPRFILYLAYFMGQVMKVRLSCYLILLSSDSKTR